MRPVILLDCDGVLADFLGAFLDNVERATSKKLCPGVRIPKNKITTWGITDCDAFESFSPQARRRFWEDVRRPGFCSSIEPSAKAKAAVEQIKVVADIRVVTTPFPGSATWVQERVNWLDTHYGLTDVVFTDEKQHVKGHLFVDDHFSNVCDWQIVQKGHAVLWKTSTNLHYSKRLPPGVVHTNSWDRVVTAIGLLAAGRSADASAR